MHSAGAVTSIDSSCVVKAAPHIEVHYIDDSIVEKHQPAGLRSVSKQFANVSQQSCTRNFRKRLQTFRYWTHTTDKCAQQS